MNAINLMIAGALGFYLGITVMCLMIIAGTDRKDEDGDDGK